MQHMAQPFSIKIFCPEGSPSGLRIISKSHWDGCGVVCPRALLPEAKIRNEFLKTGVYVLVGPSEESDLPKIYVGEGDPVGPRLDTHNHDLNKDFWTWLIFFTATNGGLNKAHVQYLEARLIQYAKEAKRANVENQNVPQLPTLSEADRSDTESFLFDMMSIFPLAGLNVFEKGMQIGNELVIDSKGITARGYETEEGFKVLQGSMATTSEVYSIPRYLFELRKELVKQNVLIQKEGSMEFVQDYVFNSPSTASGVVLGRSANGRIEWKDYQGRTLKELQEKKME